MFESIDDTTVELSRHSYIADVSLSTSIFLALKMGKPLFVEGEPGVGKTEVAKVLARALDTTLIRLQCHEGIDASQAVYEWNYQRQLLEIQAQGTRAGENDSGRTNGVFTREFLLERPLLKAIDSDLDRAAVLLIDEIDRADEEFESFLLELLSDFQITIPELGTLKAKHRPVVIITSNRTREVHDALKRRCVYQWIDYPTVEREMEIVQLKVPGITERLTAQVVRVVQALREQELYKAPGVAETLDWAAALQHLNSENLDETALESTLGLLLKYRDDVEMVRGPITQELIRGATELD
jgi:MoxR-like ATPase